MRPAWLRQSLCGAVALLITPLMSRLSAQPATSDFSALWDWEQGERRRANAVRDRPAPSRIALDSAVTRLEQLAAWCRSPVARQARSGDGHPMLVWQQSDILLDLIAVHGLRRDTTAMVASLRTLVSFLRSADSPITAGVADGGLYGVLVDVLERNPNAGPLLTHPDGRVLVDSLNALDPSRHLRPLPFSVTPGDTIPLADRIAGLSYLWSEVKYNFAHFAHVPQLDWTQLYRETLPKVIATARTYDYYKLLQAMVARLEDGHTDVQLPSPLGVQRELRPRLLNEVVDGRVFIRHIGHPALSTIGFAVGQEITHVDGVPVIEYGMTRVHPYQAASTPQDRADRTFGRWLLGGPLGTPVRLTVVDARGTRRDLMAPRDTALAWQDVPQVSIRWLPDSVAYVAITTFADASVPGQFAALMPQLRTARGLVIDVRENEGGNSGAAWAILGQLVTAPSKTPEWSTPLYRPAFRSWGRAPGTHREEGPMIQPVPGAYTGPVAVLIGPRTFSAAEDFAVAFELTARGPLIGEPTGGSTGNPLSLRLPGGGWARICSKRDTYPGGRAFVGVGVQPTIAVPRTAADAQQQRDAALARAVRAVREARTSGRDG